MRASLHFNLPEDQTEFKDAQNGNRYKAILDDLSNHIRSRLKYDDTLTHEQINIFGEIKQFLIERLSD